MRRLNIKLLALLLISVVLGGAGIFGLNRWQARRSADGLLRLADETSKNKSDPVRAIGLYDRYLRYHPDDHAAMGRYGILLADTAGSNTGQIEMALSTLSRADGLDRASRTRPGEPDAPSKPEFLRRMVKMSLMLERYADAKDYATRLMAIKGDDGDLAIAENALAREAERAREYEVADRNYKQAIAHAPNEPMNYLLRANLLRTQRNDPVQADLVMKDLVAKNPDSAQANYLRAAYLLGSADALIETNRNDDARPLLDEAARFAAKAAELEAKLPEAERGSEVRLTMVRIAMQQGDWAGARKILEPMEKEFPRDPRIYLVRADVELRSGAGRTSQAIKVLERGLRILDDVDIRWALADLLIEAGRLNDVWSKEGTKDTPFVWAPEGKDAKPIKIEPGDKGLIPELVQRSYNKGRVGYIQGRYLVARQNWKDAESTVREALPLLMGYNELQKKANRLLVACAEGLNPGDPVARSEALRRLAGNDPGTADTLVRVAQSLEALGRYDEALNTYDSIPSPTVEVRLAAARLQLMTTQLQPDEKRNWAEAIRRLDELGRQENGDFRVALLRADLLLAQGKLDEARRVLEQARRADPKKVEPWVALMILAERTRKPGDPDPVMPLLDEAGKAVGDVVPLRVLRARALAIRGGPEAKAGLTALGEGLDKFNDADRAMLLRGLANAHLRAGDPATALAIWLDYARKQDTSSSDATTRPVQVATWALAFDMALASGSEAAQDEAIKRLAELDDPSGLLTSLARSRRVINRIRALPADQRGAARAELDEARASLEKLSPDRPDDVRILLGLAQIDDLTGNTERAAAGYIRVLQLGASDLDVLRRTIELMSETGRYDQVTPLQARLRNGARAVSDLTQRNQVAADNSDYSRAVALAEKAVEQGSTDYRDHVWLARLRFAMNRQAEAVEGLLRKAVELAPDDPISHLALIEYLAASGVEKARPAVEAAGGVLEKGQQGLALAYAYNVAGLPEKADEVYRKAIGLPLREDIGSVPPTSRSLAAASVPALRSYAMSLVRQNRKLESEPLLEALIARKESPEDARWAATLLSSILLDSNPDAERSRRALELLGLSDSSGADPARLALMSENDLRAKASALAVSRDPALRKQAIAFLQQLLERPGRDNSQDLILLARLQRVQGDWALASEAYEKAIKAADRRDRQPSYLVEYIQGLIQNNQPQTIGPWIDQLDVIQPGAPVNTQLRALALKAQGQNEQATKLLVEYAGKNPAQLVSAARVLEQMGYLKDAEKLLRDYSEKNRTTNPLTGLVLAEFLGRQDRTREALDLCEPYWKATGVSPGQVANTCVTILLGKGDSEQATRVDNWVNAALASKPDDLDLLVVQAVLRSIQGQLDESKLIYRQVIKAAPESKAALVARNNLAWLLAFENGKTDEALSLVDEALDRLGGQQPAMLDTRAVVHLARDDAKAASSDLERAVSMMPEPAMYFHLARAYLAEGRKEAAQIAWRNGKLMGLNAESIDPLERERYYDAVERQMSATP